MAAQQKWGKRMNIGDEVIISAKVVGITESNNPIIQVKSGVRMLIKESDISALSEEDSTMEWKGIHDITEVGGTMIARLCGFKCSKCNKQVDHQYNFCPHCGRKAESEVKPNE